MRRRIKRIFLTHGRRTFFALATALAGLGLAGAARSAPEARLARVNTPATQTQQAQPSQPANTPAASPRPPSLDQNFLILRWSGAPEGGRSFSRAELEALSSASITTHLPPALAVAGSSRWEGVPLRRLLEQLPPAANTAGKPGHLRLTALNAYSVRVPLEDLQRYDPVLALRRDGAPISVRNNGPMILIYPFDAYPELNRQPYINRTIWQVHEIVLE